MYICLCKYIHTYFFWLKEHSKTLEITTKGMELEQLPGAPGHSSCHWGPKRSWHTRRQNYLCTKRWHPVLATYWIHIFFKDWRIRKVLPYSAVVKHGKPPLLLGISQPCLMKDDMDFFSASTISAPWSPTTQAGSHRCSHRQPRARDSYENVLAIQWSGMHMYIYIYTHTRALQM